MKRCPQCGKQFSSDANFCPVDAGRLEDVPDDAQEEPDDHLLGGRFTVEEALGGGLTGQVYRASDKQSGEGCVVKWVDAEVFSSPLQLQRTERELKQLERSSCPLIARVLGHGRRGDRLWIASEHVAGVPLDRLVEEGGPLPLERAAAIVHKVGSALSEAAKLGVIHRDVAPKNVLVGDGDEVHVINFGVAVPATGSVRGVPEFVAPEQVDGKPVDQRSNIYSLGAMMFFALAGEPPFSGDAQTVHSAHLHANPPVLSETVDGVGAEVDDILDRALAKQSSKRFMTLRQLLGVLGDLAGVEAGSTAKMVAKKKPKSSAAAQTMLGVGAFTESGTQKRSANLPGVAVGSVGGGAASGIAISSEGAEAAAASGEIGGDSVVQDDPRDAAETIPVAAPEDRAEPEDESAGEAQPEDESGGGDEPEAEAESEADEAQPEADDEPEAEPERRGKRKMRKNGQKRGKKSSKKGDKFRETLWFKKGELDEAAAEEAANGGDSMRSDKADDLPVEDRYADDGSVTDEDQDRLSLRTGDTNAMRALDDGDDDDAVSEKELVGEMKGGPWLLVGGLALVVVVVVVAIALLR